MKGHSKKRFNRESVRVWSLSNKSIEKVKRSNGKTKLSEHDAQTVYDWMAARSIKDYVTADRIRDELLDKGIEPYGHMSGSILRRAAPKVRTLKHRTDAPSLDLSESLQDWVAAKRNGDSMLADTIHADLQECGIDPNMVWPDMALALSFDSEGEVSAEESDKDDGDSLFAADEITSCGFAADPDVEETIEQNVQDADLAVAAVMARDYFDRSPVMCPHLAKLERIKFSHDLLQKAPCLIQSCDSLGAFLQKRLDEIEAAAPAVCGPPSLLRRLEEYAELAGRIASLRSATNWDVRAKRILDVPMCATSLPGCEVLQVAEQCLQFEAMALKELFAKECFDSLEELIRDRQSWAWRHTRREWLLWCKLLLTARRSMLATEKTVMVEDENTLDSQNLDGTVKLELKMVDIFNALLGGVSLCE